MARNELESVLDELCMNIKGFLNENSSVTQEHLSEYLKNAARLISGISDDALDSYNSDKHILAEEYKNIAKVCLTSYQNTSSNISELSKEHKETIAQCELETIDLPSITSKFNDIQGHMVDEVAKANSIISELSSQIKELEEKSNLDALTKVYNRGALHTYLTELCEDATDKYETHILVIDIDDFKKINDEFGHIAGDKILIYIARTLKKTLRDGDKVFRFGGEEFIVILNRTKEDECLSIAERLLHLVSDNKLIYKGHNIGVTVSIGATKLKVGDTPDPFFARADKALYRSKHTGKNKLSTEPS
jgi:diguanylate cyclase (GGDEF)-like protein